MNVNPNLEKSSHKLRSLRFLVVCFLLLVLSDQKSGLRSHDFPPASKKVNEQLKGLKSVSLSVWVSPFHIQGSEKINNTIEKTAKKVLSEAGLLLGEEQYAVLSLRVYTYLADLPDNIIVQVRTELYEEATLKREPSLQNPHGYITWSNDWVELVLKKDIKKFVLKESKSQIEDFCDDWQTAREYTIKKQERWNIDLSVPLQDDPRGVPSALIITLKNQENTCLVGYNIELNFYLYHNFYDQPFYCSGIDPSFRFLEEPIRLGAGKSISRTLLLKDLIFKGKDGSSLRYSDILKVLNASNWSVKASLSDHSLIEKDLETIPLVWSNRLNFYKDK